VGEAKVTAGEEIRIKRAGRDAGPKQREAFVRGCVKRLQRMGRSLCLSKSEQGFA